MIALDLFCGAGGASMGLHRAGFEVIGIDIRPQPRYPFSFIQADATQPPVDLGRFDFIWASPPCQKYTRMNQGLTQAQGTFKEHPDLVAPIRAMLIAAGRPYVIENVPGAPLINPFMLCGSSFDLLVQRHRLFEANFFVFNTQCRHDLYVRDKPGLHRHNKNNLSSVVGCYGSGRGRGDNVQLWQKAMGIDWMTRKELAESIPPAYSEYIAKSFLQVIKKS